MNEESDTAIKKAFEEGYKAGTIDNAPKVAALEVENAALKERVKEKSFSGFVLPFATAGSVTVGFLISEIVHSFIK